MQRRTLLLYVLLLVAPACSHSAGVTSPSSATTSDTTTTAPSTLAGRVIDQVTTSPIAAAALTLVDASGNATTTAADANGAFSYANVAAGTYGLQVNAAGYTSSYATISVPVGSLTLQLLKAGVQPVLPLSVAIVAPPTIAVGQSSQLTASIVYTDGSKQDATATVKWGVTTPAAAVSAAGLLTGYLPGATVITASIQDVQGSVPVTVVPR